MADTSQARSTGLDNVAREPEVSEQSNNVFEDENQAYDSDSSYDEPEERPKEKSRKPGNSAFRQQRMKAYNPVFTAKTVIPLLIGIAIVFIPLGAAMWYASHQVQDIAIDYSQCELQASRDHWSEIPEQYTSYNYRGQPVLANKAQWRLDTDESQPFEDERNVCRIQFEVPHDIKAPLYFFYRLEEFYANHRRFVKSFNEDQLNGKAASTDTIKNTVGGNCQPLSINDEGKKYYPCGLIANSLFNDTYSTTLQAVNGTSDDYEMTDKGIAWSSDKNRFKKTSYDYTEITPPPNWYKRFPDGYNATNVPDISSWEQFQNWMHTSGLPTFNKMALRNDNDVLRAGIYEITIGLHFPVLPFKGHKYVYISQRSVLGGKNDFLGISWMAGGGACFLLGLSLLVINFIKPRKTGDVNLLSWNREKAARDEQQAAIAGTGGIDLPEKN
ncbi:Lem3/Cdc50 [Suhomyces tanzawaensis NRRL Y-17324]|uniref:Lem3/Cdc50 n=1 Tax=Suhomyces tanzawaensis NRRL Y-17324 TaxID=984487 RepID=A0A1E4SEU0_9ASCO|nr:Lem3/Cdc50 [Suhomyces tanzawaensis NRRL Y-17324]ODV78049.1 Lem3/Cdc50 [Suhomyces tanzawaensis NRRL Y-17324]